MKTLNIQGVGSFTKKPFAGFLIFLILFSCSSNKDNHKNDIKIEKKESKLILTASLKASYSNYTNSRDRNIYYLVEVKLRNNSKNEFEFYTLTCGGLINVITDSKQVSFLYHNCSTNFGILIKLLPKQEYSFPVILFRNKYIQFNSNVKFGFILNEPKSGLLSKKTSLTNEEIFSELKLMRAKQENVIWANPIILTSTNSSPYEIWNIINDSTYSISTKN